MGGVPGSNHYSLVFVSIHVSQWENALGLGGNRAVDYSCAGDTPDSERIWMILAEVGVPMVVHRIGEDHQVVVHHQAVVELRGLVAEK